MISTCGMDQNKKLETRYSYRSLAKKLLALSPADGQGVASLSVQAKFLTYI